MQTSRGFAQPLFSADGCNIRVGCATEFKMMIARQCLGLVLRVVTRLRGLRGSAILARGYVVGYDTLKRELLELTPGFSVRDLTLHIESITAV
jgi:hypothetical protein